MNISGLRTFRRVCLPLGSAFALSMWFGCGLDKTAKQATAKAVVAATILSVPSIQVSASALAGAVPGLNGPDGGLAFDGGRPLDNALADAGLTLPAQSSLTVYFGQRQGDVFSTTPVGVTGAEVSVAQVPGSSVLLSETGQGNYTLVGTTFRYQDNATYEVRVVSQAVNYVARVDEVPALERIEAFHPPSGFVSLASNAAFSFSRPAPTAGKKRTPAFVTVFAVEGGNKGATTYTTIPSKPVDLLKLVVSPDAFATAEVTVPGSAFPEAGRNYIVMLQSAKLGGPQSDNLFTASTVIAGTADVAIIKTRAP